MSQIDLSIRVTIDSHTGEVLSLSINDGPSMNQIEIEMLDPQLRRTIAAFEL